MIADRAAPSSRSLPDRHRAGPAPPRSLLRFGVWFGLVAALIAGLAAGAIELLVDDRRATLEAAAAARIEAVAHGRAAVLDTWLDGMARIGRRLTGSELVRLFAAEMARTEPGAPPPSWLVNQRRYIGNQVADFVRQHELLGVALYGLDERTFLTSVDAPLAGIRGLGALIAELRRSGRAFGPIREVEAKGLVLDVLLPIPGPQPATSGEAAKVVAALAMTVPANRPLARVLAGLPPEGGGAVRLVQSGPTGRASVVAADDHGPRLTPAGPPIADRHADLTLEVAVPGPAWTLELVADEVALEGVLQRYRHELRRIAGAGSAGLLLVLAALWGTYNRLHRRDLSRQATALRAQEPTGAGAFDALAQLLPELVAIKTREGRYHYVNPALARALGLPAEAIVGRTDAEILGEPAAAALAASDGPALGGRAVLDQVTEVEIAGQGRTLRVFKLPLRDRAEEVMGVLVAARDTSAQVDRERERAALVGQVTSLICALAAPEASAWHVRVQRLRRYARAVARRLDLPAGERTALDQAACWSQIAGLPSFAATGSVPLLAAPDRPAAATVDRFHGASDQGRGVIAREDQADGLQRRILEVVDAFVTSTDGTTGPAISPGQALHRLAEQPERFDLRVIAALAAVVEEETRGPTAPPGASLAPAIAAHERPRRRERAA